MINEPLKFEPILKDKIWGGEKLIKLLHKKSIKNNIGESWEISNVDNNISKVISGKYKGLTITELIKTYKYSLVGNKVYKTFGEVFPLLVKFIDAKEVLSIQLHPNDEIAMKFHNSFGKTEMWYVVQADADSEIIIGFNQDVNKKKYQKYLEEENLLNLLNIEKVSEGDVFFIPPGRIHAIGKGVLLAEIQQTSDITYRIYDWDRKDAKGNYRDLHTTEALKSIDFNVKTNYKTNYNVELNKNSKVISCPFFTTNIISIKGDLKINHSDKDSFIIYMCVKGNVIFANNNFTMDLNFGETLLIPNSLNTFEIISKEQSELLEIYIE